MAITTYTKSGAKASKAEKLADSVFGVEVKNHQLLHLAYNAYLAAGRTNNATTKLRGEVRGGGKKPWKQKGTGRARAGSIRSPLWRGGGITFGPDGAENYTKKLSVNAKRTALRQALSLAKKEGNIAVIEEIDFSGGKTADVAKLLAKLNMNRSVLIVVGEKDMLASRATRNLPHATLVQASYLNVHDVLNAHSILLTKKALPIIEEWLGGDK